MSTGWTCSKCGRLWVCATGTAASISPMPNPCRVCGGSGQVWRNDDYYTCLRCEGDGWDTPLEGCCDCGDDYEEDEPE
jgi:A2L zinc ribbon domain